MSSTGFWEAVRAVQYGESSPSSDGSGNSNGYNGGTRLKNIAGAGKPLAGLSSDDARRETRAKQYLSQAMPSINFAQYRAEMSGPTGQAVNEKTQEKAKARYETASAQYENKSKQLDKLIAQSGDYAGYGADLEKAKTSTADAKAKMEEAADAYRALGGTIEADNNQRVGKTIAGGAENYLASLLGTVGSYHEGGVRGSKAQIERDLADLQTQADKAQQTYDEMLAKYGDENNVNVKAAASALAEIKSNQELYQGMLDNQSLERTSQAIYGASDRMAERGAQNIAEAKEGLGAGGQFLVDTGAAGVQLLGDIALGKVTGLGMMPVMGARSYGGGANEARQAGATYEQQFLAGGATAAVEMLTEKLADGLAGVAGKGAADDAAKEIIRKWAKTDAGRTALRAVYGISGEAGEEAISTLVSPLIERIYNDEALKESYGTAEGRKQLLNEALHDALVGGALGGLGTFGSFGNGQNAAELADMRMRDASMGDVQSRTNNAFDVLFGNMSPEQAQAREAAALARLNVNEQAAPAPAVQEAPVPVAQETTGQDALLEAAGITPAAQEAVPAPAAPVEQPTPEAVSLESRQAQIQQRLDEISAELDNPNIDDARADELMAEGGALYAEKNTVEQQIKARNTQQERIDSGDVSKRFGEPENHIDNRTNAQVQNPSVKAFQYDHPELHQHFVEAAQALANLVQSAQTVDIAVRNRKTDSKYYENKRNRYADTVRSLVELGLTKPEILQCCQDIIDNNGAENYSKAKKVELVLNDMLTNGYTTADGIVEPNAEYIAAKEAINGAKAKPAADSWEAYLERNELALSLGEVTEEQLRAEWEAQQAAERAAERAEDAGSVITPADAQTANNAPSGALKPPAGEIMPEVNESRSAQEVESRSRSIEGQASAYGQEYEAPKHITKPEIESLTNAVNRVDSDMNGETQRLLSASSWTGEDIDAAMVINGRLLVDAIENNDFTASDAWRKVVEEHKQEAGRSLQALSKWARGGQAVVQKANKDLSESNIPTDKRVQTLSEVQNFANRFDLIEPGDAESVRKLILDMSDARETGTFIKSLYGKLLDRETDFDYLKEYAMRQLMAIPGDVTNKADFGQRLKTWQTLAQLLRITTTMRNVIGNETFGLFDLVPQNTVGWMLDSLVSAVDGTGVHTVGPEISWLNSHARQAMKKGIERSVLEIAGDVYMGGENAYSTQGLRTNKASGNAFEHALSRAEQLSGYALTTTDVAASKRQMTSYADMLERMNGDKLTPEQREALAKNITDYRLFKNNGVARKVSQGAHDLMNRIGIGGELYANGALRRGGFGGAEVFGFNYPGVPANLGVKPLEYSPANVAKGIFELVKYGVDTKNSGTPDLVARQNAVMDIARGATGTALICGIAGLLSAGVLRYYDDEDDYDVLTQNKAEGKTGTLFNVSAMGRLILGKDPSWQDTDRVMNLAYVQPLNSLFAIAHYVSKDFKDGGVTPASLAADFGKGAWNGLLDMPVMQSISKFADVINTKYDEETGGSKVLDAMATVAGNFVTGMIPGASSQTAKALDTVDRDTSGDSVFERTVNAAKKAIPGLRETLPVKYDAFGNPITLDENAYDRVMNALVRPGTISTVKQSDASKVIGWLIEQTGDKSIMPDARAPHSVTLDGEKVDLSASEQQAFKKSYGSAVTNLVNETAESDLFKSASPDVQAGIIGALEAYAKDRAKAELAKQRGIEYSSDYQKLLDGIDEPGPGIEVHGLDPENVADYLAFGTAFKSAVKSGDYAAVDSLVGQLPNYNENMQTVLGERSKRDDNMLNHLSEAAGLGVGAESYFKYKAAQDEAQIELDKASDRGGDVKMLALANADIPEVEKAALLGSEAVGIGKNFKSAYDVLSNYGYTVADVNSFFDDADWSYNTKTGEYEADNELSPLEVAAAIRNMGMSHSESSALFKSFSDAFVTSGNPKYDSWRDDNGKPWSYDSEIRYIDRTGYKYTKANAPNPAETPALDPSDPFAWTRTG